MRLTDFMTIPNLLSIARILLAPLIGYCLSLDTVPATIVAMLLVIVAGITDGLDGYLARRWGQVSELGIALDPVADKIFAGILVLVLIWFRDFPIWLASIIIGRDLVILLLGSIIIRKYRVVIPSNLAGKYAFAAIAMLLASYVVKFEPQFPLMTWVTVFFISLSIIGYSRVFVSVMRTGVVPQYKDRSIYRIGRTIFTTCVLSLFFFYFIRAILSGEIL